MSLLLSCSLLSKSFSSRPLFEGITLNIMDGERIGMLGPNGAGKSTLLKIFAGLEDKDKGDIFQKRNLKLAYLKQDEQFPKGQTIEQTLNKSLAKESLSELQKQRKIGEIRSIIGFPDLNQNAESLSGGWKKRLSIAAQIITEPDLLLLDEPTNHLDLEGICWLEEFIKNIKCSVIIISHDRTLLENVTTRIIEINRIYPQGFFSIDGNYSRFLEKREVHLQGIARYEDSLKNKVRREIQWLRQGAKARTTKAKGRIQSANTLINELQQYENRSNSQGTSNIDFFGSGRKTKNLIKVENVSKNLGNRQLFQDLSFTLTTGIRLGVVGANGCGKSTLLKIIDKTLTPDSGSVEWAEQLRVVKFEQDRVSLNKELSLKRILAPDSDHLVYRDNEIHVASWAKRFLFRSEQLDMPVRSLSGGEQARLLIAKLMLKPADILLLDEPTNDLDIDTLQVLEESLEEFPGALVLVTHDRFMLDRLSTVILGIDKNGSCNFFASYSQWEDYLKEIPEEDSKISPSEEIHGSKLQLKELEKLEKQIAKLEKITGELKAKITQPEIIQDAPQIERLCQELHQKEEELQKLVETWADASKSLV